MNAPRPALRRRPIQPGVTFLERRELMAALSIAPNTRLWAPVYLLSSVVIFNYRLTDGGIDGPSNQSSTGYRTEDRAGSSADYRSDRGGFHLALATATDPAPEAPGARVGVGGALFYTVRATEAGEVPGQPVVVTLRSRYIGSGTYPAGGPSEGTGNAFRVAHLEAHAAFDWPGIPYEPVPGSSIEVFSGEDRPQSAVPSLREATATFRTAIGETIGIEVSLSTDARDEAKLAASLTLDASLEVLAPPSDPGPVPEPTPEPVPEPIELTAPTLAPLAPPAASSPAVFRWGPVAGAAGYRLDLTDLTAATTTRLATDGATFAITPTPLVGGHDYSWTVSAIGRSPDGAESAGPASPAGRFAVEAADASPPNVARVGTTLGRRGRRSISVAFDEAIDPATAGLGSNYAVLVRAGRTYRPVRIRSVAVVSDRTVTLIPSRRIGRRQALLVRVGGTIRDLAGNLATPAAIDA